MTTTSGHWVCVVPRQKVSFASCVLAIAIAIALAPAPGCSGERDNRKAAPRAGQAGLGGAGAGIGGTSMGGSDDDGGATGTGAEPAGRSGSSSGASGRAGAGGLGGSSAIAGFGGVSGIGGAGGAGTAGSLGTAGFSGSKGSAGTAGQAAEPPEGWLCRSFYGDGVCDCGCAAMDVDCGEAPTIAACSRCGGDSCSPHFCPGNIDPLDITRCTQPPPSWSCADPLWDDGAICDCGCGYPDPDCSSVLADACDTCNEPGSCSVQACPGTVHPDMNSLCRPLPPPPGWTCWETGYGDGESCECGCGVPDLDCITGDIEHCDLCSICGGGTCAEEVDPADTTVCLPPPTGWTCDDHYYRDNSGDCDCGCGVFDPNCEEVTASWCSYCPEEGCTGGDCDYLDPDDNALCKAAPSGWTCNPIYYDDLDDACDCGCGVSDPDCLSANRSACDICDSEGSCSATPCPGTIASADNATCGS